jgi:Ca2+-binding EF-hand superfamily protein
MLTDYQRRKFTRAFELVDDDGSAFVDRGDLARIAARFVQQLGIDPGSEEHRVLAARSAELWNVLAHMDDDGDGRLTLDEWLRALESITSSEQTYEHLFGELVDQSFELLDSDADGAVTCEEFVLWVTATNLDAAEARAAFEEYDLDEDGLLSRSELGYVLLDFFYSSDPDGRGNWFLEF